MTPLLRGRAFACATLAVLLAAGPARASANLWTSAAEFAAHAPPTLAIYTAGTIAAGNRPHTATASPSSGDACMELIALQP